MAHGTTAIGYCTDKSQFPYSFLETLKYIMEVKKETGTDFNYLVSETKINRNIKSERFISGLCQNLQ